jgi:hypothetical protein
MYLPLIPPLTHPAPETRDEEAGMTEEERLWVMATVRRIERSGFVTASVSWPGHLAGGAGAGGERRAVDLFITTELDSIGQQEPPPSKPSSPLFHNTFK